MANKSVYTRQAEYRARQKDKGMIFMQKWVTPEEKAAIDALVDSMRRTTAEARRDAA